VRSAVVSVRGRPYVEAARGLGASGMSLLFRDIFPSVLPVLIVQFATAFAWGVLDEASIGFLGLGVQPPNPSWGSLLIEGRQYMFQTPWLSIGAGLMVVITVLGVNLLADGMNDLVDPRSGGARR
jgi:peptide/nickel transport system permease protein